APLAAAFEEQIGGWTAIFNAERSSRRNVTRSEAFVAVRNAQIDRLTSRFASMVKAQNAALLQRFFGTTTPSRFITQALRRQCEKTRDVVLVELDKLDANHPLRTFAAPLKAACDAALDALDARNGAKGARQTVANDADEYKEAVNRLRTTTYADLLKVA